MKTYLITYELTFQDTNSLYNNFFNKIKSFKMWARPFRSTWLIKTSSSREAVMEYLRPGLTFNDKILIIQVTDDWIALRLPDKVVNWMRGGL